MVLGAPGIGNSIGKPAEARWELRVRNFSAKFLSIRQVAVSTSLGCGVEDGGGGLVPTHPGKAHTSPAVCGRQAWRPHSQTFNKHEIITLGTAAVAAAATLLYSGTSPGGRSGLRAHAQSVHFSSPSRGREATPLSQGQESVRDKGKRGPKRRGQRPLAREKTPACLPPPQPLLGLSSDLLYGESLKIQRRGAGVDILAPHPIKASPPPPESSSCVPSAS